ncbi:MAG: hypothetical protein ACOX4Q_08890 [Syntrophomonadales bacterium]
MKKIGNPRLVLWILIAALLVYVGYIYKTGENQPGLTTPTVSQATVINDFREMKNIQVPTEAELGGHFFATELLFPAEFEGRVGDVFYVRMEDGHILATISYRVEEVTDEVPAKATYTPLKDHGPDYVPEGDYTTRSIEEQLVEAED